MRWKMSNEIVNGIIFLGIFSVAVYTAALFAKQYKENNPDIRVGQVWEWRSNDNPFEPSLVCTNTVLDVKGRYVKYNSYCLREGERPIERVTSYTSSWFIVGSKLIKETE